MATSLGDSGKTPGDSSGKLPCSFHNCFQSTSFMKHTKPTHKHTIYCWNTASGEEGNSQKYSVFKTKGGKGKKVIHGNGVSEALVIQSAMRLHFKVCFNTYTEVGQRRMRMNGWNNYRKNPPQNVCAAEIMYSDCLLIIIFLMQQLTVW